MVHDDCRVHDESWNGATDLLAVYGESDSGHRRSIFSWSGRRPLLRDREGSRRAPHRGRLRAMRRPALHRIADDLHSASAGLQPLLHADARPREQPRVPPHPVAGAAVPADPCLWDDRVDRGRAVHQLRAEQANDRGSGADGMAAWVLRYALFAMAAPAAVFWMILLGVALHGPCYDFFFVTGQIYVDKKSTPAIRGQAQGFLVLVTYGVGMLIGAQVAGRVYNSFLAEATSLTLDQWRSFWIFPAAFAAAVLLFFAAFFRAPARQPTGVGQQPIR